LFAADGQGRVRNTAMGERFRSDHPQSLRPGLLMSLSPLFWRPLGELEESIRTGRPSFDTIFGRSFFDHLSEHPAAAEEFAAWMNASSVAVVPTILRAWDFSRYKTIVDVGGGHGALLAGILSAYPHLRGVLYDQPAVTSGAHAVRTEALAGRCEVISGSFFDSVPSHGDAYILRAILHDWDDEKSLAILRNCRHAMKPDTTLLVLESLREKGNHLEFLDLHMLAQMGGCERSLEEHGALLREAGFHPARLIRTDGPAILEAVAV
jgi:hypothetical protein